MREDVVRRRQELSTDKQALLRKRLRPQQEEVNCSRLIPAREHHGPFPLSFAQQRLWFLQQLEPENAAYNEIMAARLIGPLRYPALLEAVRALIARHPMLHTHFYSSEGEVFQQVEPLLPDQILLPLRDLQHLSISQREQAIQQQIAELIGRPFHLTTELPWRALLLSIQPEEHVVLVGIHHIITDGWSMGFFMHELGIFYAAACQGMTVSPLPPLAVQYSDFVLWQHTTLQGSRLSELLAYWRAYLSGAPALLELPTDRPRPPIQTSHGQSIAVHVPAPTVNALRSLAQQEDSTLFMVLLAAFALILSYYSQQEDVVIGSPVAGRIQPELEDVFGLFVNMLPLRIDLSGDPTLRQLIQRARTASLNAYNHQDLPFEKLIEELHPHRSLSHSPLFQAILALQNMPLPQEKLMDLQLSHLEIQTGYAKYELSLTLEERGQEIQGMFEYNSDLWNASTMERFLLHWLRLLDEMAHDSLQHLSSISLLSETELFQQLVEWNPQPFLSPEIAPIHTLFEQHVSSIPSQTALVYKDESLTYQALNRRANRLARLLSSMSIVPETLVAISMDRSLDLVVALLAVLKVGAAYVPLDPTYPAGRLAFILQDSAAPVLLTQQRLVSHFTFFKGEILTVVSINEASDSQDDANLPWSGYADTLAYVIYTSGSTGQPKGVAVTHRNLFHAYRAYEQAYQLHPASTVHLQMASFSFDVFSGDIIRSLCSGGTLVLCPRETLLEPASLYHLLHSQHVTHAEFVPAILRTLLHYLQQTGQALQFMRTLIVSSDIWFLHEHQLLNSLSLPSTRCINSYGVTEATIDSSYSEEKQFSLPAGNIAPIGRPYLGMQLYVLDQWLHPLPTMVVGELYIGGCGITRGYLNQPELTAERFLPHPFSQTPGARIYRTRDKARFLPDGTVEFLGRVDHQIKLRGFRIELGEIESVLNMLSEVQECVVIVREDQPGDSRLVAYIVPASSLTAEELILQLRNHLKQHLPEYMLPSTFVILSSLPLTSNGKIDRLTLPAPLLTTSEQNFVAPRTPTEKQLAQIWCDLLGRPQVGIYEDFFDLGGHSMLAMRLVSQIHKHFDTPIGIAALFECRTIAALAPHITPESVQEPTLSSSIPALPVVEIQRSAHTRPLFCVHPAGGTVLCYVDLARHLGDEQSCYALQSPGVDGEQEPLRSIEAMAQTYIEGIRNVQPQGPYSLLGWSLGGTIAFEIAQQLRQQGQEVAPLILLDSWAPTPLNKAEDQKRPLLELFFQYMAQGTLQNQSFFHQMPELPSDTSFQQVMEWTKRMHIVSLDLEVHQMHALFQVFEANYHAWHQYIPQPYAGHLVLFTAREQPLRRSVVHDEQMGWYELSLQEVDVFTLPGTHFSLLKEPQVQALAQQVTALLKGDINELERAR